MSKKAPSEWRGSCRTGFLRCHNCDRCLSWVLHTILRIKYKYTNTNALHMIQ